MINFGCYAARSSRTKSTKKEVEMFLRGLNKPWGTWDFVEKIVASDWAQTSDRDAGFGMNECETAISAFHRHGTGVKFEFLD
jgi:hypothetical protein